MTLTDTSSLIAVIDKGDASHTGCLGVLKTATVPRITTWPCYTETMYFLGKLGGYYFQQALWRMRRDGKLLLYDHSVTEADRMEVLMTKYKDLPMDLADASLVVAAETLGLKRVFTLDSHFYAYRLGNGGAFEVVP